MITNIDDNLGATRKLLKDLGIHDDTIFIFTTDNGSQWSNFQCWHARAKGEWYDGGHRVHFSCWPMEEWTKSM